MLKILEAIRPNLATGKIPPAEDWIDIVRFLRVFIDRCHHGKEERVLFPAVVQAADEETLQLVEQLLIEHVEGRRLLTALATAAGTDPVLPGDPQGQRPFDAPLVDRAIAGYVGLMRPHVVQEERQLYPAADRILAPELQETLRGEYALIEQEVTGPGLHEDFQETVERLGQRYLPGQGSQVGGKNRGTPGESSGDRRPLNR
jgi:hemerythrin-like domain-containing protein